MRPDEGRTFLEIQARAVRGLATHSYPQEVIDGWAARSTDEHVHAFLANRDHEIRLIAEIDGQPIGLGALVLTTSELRACYVVPEAARRGVGSVLVREIERLARHHGLSALELEGSLNAEPFYAALGYAVVERHEIVLRSGARMAAVRMRKEIAGSPPE
jgi:putative acetyltransferase